MIEKIKWSDDPQTLIQQAKSTYSKLKNIPQDLSDKQKDIAALKMIRTKMKDKGKSRGKKWVFQQWLRGQDGIQKSMKKTRDKLELLLRRGDGAIKEAGFTGGAAEVRKLLESARTQAEMREEAEIQAATPSPNASPGEVDTQTGALDWSLAKDMPLDKLERYVEVLRGNVGAGSVEDQNQLAIYVYWLNVKLAAKAATIDDRVAATASQA